MIKMEHVLILVKIEELYAFVMISILSYYSTEEGNHKIELF